MLQIGDAQIYLGNSLEVLKTLPDNSVDSIVTDPPYELGFMGKSWDNSGIAYSIELWQQCLKVLKPGGHLLAFGGTRTWHRLAVAIEEAGFEIRDSIAWIYGSGFPKSHNISKAIDKAAGAEREVTATIADRWAGKGNIYARASEATNNSVDITVPATKDAKKWEGWGTALKPAHEPIVVARKPLIGTVAENVLKYGTGGLNIDVSRIGTEQITINTFDNGAKPFGDAVGEPYTSKTSVGRFPANIILDEFTAELLDEQSGISKDGIAGARTGKSQGYGGGWGPQPNHKNGYNGQGGASRFFYVAKASKRDRNEGLEHLPEQILTGRDEGQDERQVPYKTRSNPVKNTHPTVKPTALMQYLIRLVTPENGLVLDPFTGSGSTGKAALIDGYKFIGIELTEEYLPIIKGRLEYIINQKGLFK